MNQIRCIIVDDEKEARLGLHSLLSSEKDIEVIASCKNGIEAITMINEYRPDLIFLDIQMPDVNGFEVLASLEHPRPSVIFVTAFDQYAIKAFEVHAIDYLLKPYSDERLIESLENARKQLKKIDNRIAGLLSSKANSSKNELVNHKEKDRLIFKSEGQVHFLEFDNISWIEAYDYYVKIHVDQRFFLLRETMKRLESKMPAHIIRVHKSAIVNTKYITSTKSIANSEMEVTLSTGETIKVSRGKKRVLLDAL